MKACAIILGLLSLLLSAACTQVDSRGEMPVGKRMRIVTTTGMLKDAVANIVGDAADVEAIMGSGVDPHLYKATQGDLNKLTEADVIIYNGLHLEGKMGEVLEKLSRYKTVLAATAGIPENDLLNSAEYSDSFDPHVWFDVSLWMKVVLYVSSELQKKDPQHAALYQEQTDAYMRDLSALHNETKAAIASIPEQQRILITAHDAFGYYGQAYAIEVRGLQGISTLSEFGLQDVSSLVKFIVANKIKAVFVESSVSPKAIEAVVEGCRKRGHTVRIGGTLFSDAMGEAGTPEGTYTGMVRHNTNTIVTSLK
ncbi:metal ABC transporter solute-binding protein, Zn/Mn family [Pontibacter ramchanderi]|uniref:Manganese/zinc/iron transport system substrate-binding protein n=1 Tax=Pontibacter ramchanderi TaxID=1179743 RepID=A0A2N3V293_9BACT|nr:zinc ABC transporter substrate-binding protein [Pontibacter ramchanderi]PKV75713.1 manganese/zinc/iron transport system substrate-binding protein [Pontibacter ramchanderi]